MEVLIGMIVFFGLIAVFSICGVAYAILTVVKLRRAHVWYEKHGYEIGGREFFDWCRENGVNPSYFF